MAFLCTFRDLSPLFNKKIVLTENYQLNKLVSYTLLEISRKKEFCLGVYAKRFATYFTEKMKTNGRKIHPITGIRTAREPRTATTMMKTRTAKMY